MDYKAGILWTPQKTGNRKNSKQDPRFHVENRTQIPGVKEV